MSCAHLWWRRLLVIALVAFVGRVHLSQHGLVAGDTVLVVKKADYVSILRMLESKIRANDESIRTWSAVYETDDAQIQAALPQLTETPRAGASTVVMQKRLPGPFWVEGRSVIQFDADLVTGTIRTSQESVGSPKGRHIVTKKIVTGQQVDIRRIYVLSRTQFLEAVLPASERVREAKKRLSHSPPRLRPRIVQARRRPAGYEFHFTLLSDCVDPRRFFEIGGTSVAQSLNGKAAWIAAGKAAPMEISAIASPDGIVYTTRIEYRMGGPQSHEKPLVETTAYGPSAGYNVISSCTVNPDGSANEQIEINYSRVSGIYVPKLYHAKRFKAGTGQPEAERKFHLIDVRLNEPIDSAAFTWKGLGLSDGDAVRDEVEGKDVVYSQGEVVADAAHNPTDGSDGGRNSDANGWNRRRLFLLIANLGLLAAFAIYLIAKRLRARPNSQ